MAEMKEKEAAAANALGAARVTDAMVEAACLGYWPAHWPQQFAVSDADSIRGHMRQALVCALASADPGVGIAAARKAAEEMRERAAKVADNFVERSWHADEVFAARTIATAIRALPSSPDHEKATATPTIAKTDGEANHG